MSEDEYNVSVVPHQANGEPENTRKIYFADNVEYTIQGNKELDVNNIKFVTMTGAIINTGINDNYLLLNLTMTDVKKPNKLKYIQASFNKDEENNIYYVNQIFKTDISFKNKFGGGNRRKTKKYKRKNTKNKSKKKSFS